MAFTSIPNEAIDRMTELSAGAWRLYCFLARCRNQTTGKCCPSVRVTAEAIDVHPKNIFKLRNELAAAKWARFDGDHVSNLLGIGGSKNATTDAAIIELKPESSKNTTIRAIGSKNATVPTPVVAKTLPMVAKTLPKGSKNATPIHEEQDERTRLIEQDEDKARHKAVVPPSVAYIRQLTRRYPDKTLWPRIVKTLGEDFDEGRLTECYEDWVSHGWNKMNLVWLFEWYVKGIPQGRNGHAKPTLAERNQAAFDEAARQLGIYDENVIEGEIL